MVLSFSINRPDDWHVHLRDGEVLQHTVPATAMHFARALVMPNLSPALTTWAPLLAYRERILLHKPEHHHFEPYMTLYLTDQTSPDLFHQAPQHAYVLGAKLYPAGSTTHSSQGIASIQSLYPVFEAMQTQDLVLQIHGEVTYGDIFEREELFIETQLAPLVQAFPRLRIVLEHISTRAAVDFVIQAPHNVAATITPHHLLYHRNHLLVGGIKPHYYCLPILKHEHDQRALQRAAVSGNPKFFAGTDSAPHAQAQKESACGCAGIFSAPYALSFYTQVFDELDCLDKLNDFMSGFGADFYHLSRNTEKIELLRQPLHVPSTVPWGQEKLIPMAAGCTLAWSVHDGK